MEIEHDTATQEPMSLNLYVKTAIVELKELDIFTQEPVFLKTFVEIASKLKLLKHRK